MKSFATIATSIALVSSFAVSAEAASISAGKVDFVGNVEVKSGGNFFDFVGILADPVPGRGSVLIQGSSTGIFAPFIGKDAWIKDVNVSSTLPITNFLDFDNTLDFPVVSSLPDGIDIFDFININSFAINDTTSGSEAKLDLGGIFNVGGVEYEGKGILTAQFTGKTKAQVEAALATGKDPVRASFSGNLEAVKTTPEPGLMLGLSGLAVAGIVSRKKQKSN